MRTSKTKQKFDAVMDSRKWKETVVKETECMPAVQAVAYFDCTAVRQRFEAALSRAKTNGPMQQ